MGASTEYQQNPSNGRELSPRPSFADLTKLTDTLYETSNIELEIEFRTESVLFSLSRYGGRRNKIKDVQVLRAPTLLKSSLLTKEGNKK